MKEILSLTKGFKRIGTSVVLQAKFAERLHGILCISRVRAIRVTRANSRCVFYTMTDPRQLYALCEPPSASELFRQSDLTSRPTSETYACLRLDQLETFELSTGNRAMLSEEIDGGDESEQSASRWPISTTDTLLLEAPEEFPDALRASLRKIGIPPPDLDKFGSLVATLVAWE